MPDRNPPPPKAKDLLDQALALHNAADIDDRLSGLTEKVLAFFDAERVRLFAYDAMGNEVYTRVRLSDTLTELKFAVSEESVAGYTALHKQTVAIENVRDLTTAATRYPGLRYDARYEDRTGVRVRSILSVPLMEGGVKIIGIIQLVNTAGPVDAYTDDDIDLLIHLGRLVALAVFQHDERQRRATKFDLLVEEGIVSPEELTEALRFARENAGDPILEDPAGVLLERFGVPRTAMQASLSRYYLTDFLPFDPERIIPVDLFKGINANYCRAHFVAPLELADGTLTLMLADPSNTALVRLMKQTYLAQHCKLFVGLRQDILRTIDQALGGAENGGVSTTTVRAVAENGMDAGRQGDENILNEDAPLVVQVVNKLVLEAYQRKVSDIHVEPGIGDSETVVRYRMDGACYRHTQIPAAMTPAVINRIKLMAGLKIDEHRFPQSGKIRLRYGDTAIELRVETTPTVGKKEDVVLRILAGGTFLSLDDLDLAEANRSALVGMITKPYGILLAVGPTGSGKTTTLHALLHHLNSEEKKIWTVEDPVEITQPGLRQVQVNLNIKPEPFDFAKAMRSFLRADPDIIMVGEMRDKETAKIAIEASLTGHLVLSTLHTNSAPETITRLLEMGIDPLNVADSLLGVLAQRLVRLLCPDCKAAYAPVAGEIRALEVACGREYAGACHLEDPVETLYRPVGCETCSNLGYRGRAGIHELLQGSPGVKAAISAGQPMAAIRDQALADGMSTLKMDGIRRVVAGQTTLAEVLKVCID